jgi:hypothetical protein
VSVPLGVVTVTNPVVAPVGTVVLISDAEFAVMLASVPLKLTPVAPVRFVPRIVTDAPTLPEASWVLTKGFKPIEKL